MSDQNEEEEIIKKFLCCVPLKGINFDPRICEEEQEKLLQSTAFHPVCVRHPISDEYQRNFFKKLISVLESNGKPVFEGLYEHYVKLVSCDSVLTSYKSYYIAPIKKYVSISESKMFLSNGTTGLTTWPGSLCLAEWIIEHNETLRGKSVIELGSGSGLLGIIASLVCEPASYIFTDYHKKVLDALKFNITLNSDNDDDSHISRNASDDNFNVNMMKIGKSNVSVCALDWCNSTDQTFVRPLVIDVILAADVVFDPYIVPGLVRTLSLLLESQSGRSVSSYFSVTVRNCETFELFLNELKKRNLVYQTLQCAPSNFYYDKTAEIHLLKIFQCPKMQ